MVPFVLNLDYDIGLIGREWLYATFRIMPVTYHFHLVRHR